MSDTKTKLDYKNQKEKFYKRMKKQSSSEKKNILNFKKFNLIQIGENEPLGINKYVYLLFVIVPFIELYKIYLEYYFANGYQLFEIKKTLSIENDLDNKINEENILEKSNEDHKDVHSPHKLHSE